MNRRNENCVTKEARNKIIFVSISDVRSCNLSEKEKLYGNEKVKNLWKTLLQTFFNIEHCENWQTINSSKV